MTEVFNIDKDKVRIQMIHNQMGNLNQLAEQSGIARSTITYLLKEGHNWTSENAVKIAKALNCHPFDILTIEGFPPPKANALASA